MEVSSKQYNSQPLAGCKGYYIGKAVPLETLKPPEIVQRPLAEIYTPFIYKRRDHQQLRQEKVLIRVFSSGIVIERVNRHDSPLTWYPIQNLYCSAALLPVYSGGKVGFKELTNTTKKDGNAKPLFAMVVRETEKDRKILLCHAFSICEKQRALLLVEATKQAYSHREGWNHPITDKTYVNAKMSYTLRMIEDGEDSDLTYDTLRKVTESRERSIKQTPDIQAIVSPPILNGQIMDSRSQKHVTIQSARPAPSQRVTAVSRSRPASAQSLRPVTVMVPQTQQTRSQIMSPKRQMLAIGSVSRQATSAQPSLRRPAQPSPKQKEPVKYQGFRADFLTAAEPAIPVATIQAVNVSEYPLSRSSSRSSASHQMSPQVISVPTSRNHSLADRSPRKSTNRKGHRVLASSEPQEMVNDIQRLPMVIGDLANGKPKMNGNSSGLEILDWEAVPESVLNPKEQKKPTKHQRVSRKKMEKYLQENGVADNGPTMNGNGVSVSNCLRVVRSNLRVFSDGVHG